MKITVKAPAKINLTLDILGKLPSGYHSIETVMQSITLSDEITIRDSDKIKIISSAEIPLDEKNLAWKAADLLKKRFEISDNVAISIKKEIPVAAGLGGGSSDAAAVLKALNSFWQLGLSENELVSMASNIGCDCCFCVGNGTAFASGIGEKITRLGNIPKLNLVLACPGIPVLAKDAYSSLPYERIGKARKTRAMIEAIKNRNMEGIAENLHNDFEFTILEKHPIISEIKRGMLENGALGSIMSGSGSAVFGIAENRKSADQICRSLREKFNFMKIISTQNENNHR